MNNKNNNTVDRLKNEKVMFDFYIIIFAIIVVDQ